MPRVEFKSKKEIWVVRQFVNGPLDGTSEPQPEKKKKFTYYLYDKEIQGHVIEHVYRLIAGQFMLTDITHIQRIYR
jgi:hypothetical protein